MKPGMAYLAAPYTADSEGLQRTRFLAINAMAAQLMREGELVLSPISHGVPIAEAGELPHGFNFWHNLCRAQLSACNRMYVLMLDGWSESAGVAMETAMARKLGIPVSYLPMRYGK